MEASAVVGRISPVSRYGGRNPRLGVGTFEIVAVGLALNAAMRLQHDRAATGWARRAIGRPLEP